MFCYNAVGVTNKTIFFSVSSVSLWFKFLECYSHSIVAGGFPDMS